MSDEWVDPFWDCDGPCPTPKEGKEIKCPICGGDTIIRGYFHHMRPQSPMPFRVDVGLKCTHCAHIWYHGVKMKEEFFAGHGHQFNRRGTRLTVEMNGVIMPKELNELREIELEHMKSDEDEGYGHADT